MRRILAILALLGAAAAPLVGNLLQPPVPQATDTPRVLVVGDSWAQYIWEQRTVRKALSRAGHPGLTERGALTAISGSTAAEWASPTFLALITAELAAYPTIDVVQLSIGGNDLLGNWNASWTAAQELALMQQVQADTETVVDHILAQRPGLQVVILGYDYPNFQEMAPIFSIDWFLWLYLGSPSPSRMGHALAEFETFRRDYALAEPQVDYVHALGLMQWWFGYPLYNAPPFAAPYPGQAPTYLPFPGGSPNHPSPPAALTDSFHLNVDGYKVLVGNATYHVYKPYFDANP